MKSKIEIQEKLFQKKYSLKEDDEGRSDMGMMARRDLQLQIDTLEWVLK